MYFLIVAVSINISCFLLPTTIKQKPLPSNFVPFSGCVCDIIDDLAEHQPLLLVQQISKFLEW